MLTNYTFYKFKGLTSYNFIQADFSYSSFSDSKYTLTALPQAVGL